MYTVSERTAELTGKRETATNPSKKITAVIPEIRRIPCGAQPKSGRVSGLATRATARANPEQSREEVYPPRSDRVFRALLWSYFSILYDVVVESKVRKRANTDPTPRCRHEASFFAQVSPASPVLQRIPLKPYFPDDDTIIPPLYFANFLPSALPVRVVSALHIPVE